MFSIFIYYKINRKKEKFQYGLVYSPSNSDEKVKKYNYVVYNYANSINQNSVAMQRMLNDMAKQVATGKNIAINSNIILYQALNDS